MKVKLFAVLDSCSGVYDGPVPAHNEAVALRNFVKIAKKPGSPIHDHPEHFSLWRVGEWNDSEATKFLKLRRVWVMLLTF